MVRRPQNNEVSVTWTQFIGRNIWKRLLRNGRELKRKRKTNNQQNIRWSKEYEHTQEEKKFWFLLSPWVTNKSNVIEESGRVRERFEHFRSVISSVCSGSNPRVENGVSSLYDKHIDRPYLYNLNHSLCFHRSVSLEPENAAQKIDKKSL